MTSIPGSGADTCPRAPADQRGGGGHVVEELRLDALTIPPPQVPSKVKTPPIKTG